MKETLVNVKRIKTGRPGKLLFEVEDPQDVKRVLDLIRYQERKRRDPSPNYQIRIRTPWRPRTTGARSQNARFRGQCRTLAAQFQAAGHDYSDKDVAEAMKRMAVGEGIIPTKLGPDGEEVPVSEADWSVEQESRVIEEIVQPFADSHGFYLIEYDEKGRPYRTVGGRSRQEMARLNH